MLQHTFSGMQRPKNLQVGDDDSRYLGQTIFVVVWAPSSEDTV